MITQRAYQLFEGRGFQHGLDVEDWLQAEDEIVHGCRHDLRESEEAITLRAEMPSSEVTTAEIGRQQGDRVKS